MYDAKFTPNNRKSWVWSEILDNHIIGSFLGRNLNDEEYLNMHQLMQNFNNLIEYDPLLENEVIFQQDVLVWDSSAVVTQKQVFSS